MSAHVCDTCGSSLAWKFGELICPACDAGALPRCPECLEEAPELVPHGPDRIRMCQACREWYEAEGAAEASADREADNAECRVRQHGHVPPGMEIR